MVIITILLLALIYFFDLSARLKDATGAGGGQNAPFFTDMIYGDLEDPLERPMAVMRVDDHIYVADNKNKRIQVFTLSGKPAFKFGKEGAKEGEFMFPYGLAYDGKANIYVADMYNGKISIFDKNGKFLKYFKEADEKNPIIKGPAGLKIVNDKLYVTDTYNFAAYVFSLDGKKLLELKTAANQVIQAPNDIEVDENENIYVSDSLNNRVIKFNKSGKYLLTINGSKAGKGNPQFINTRGIAINSSNVLYIIDNLSHVVRGYSLDGKELFTFGGFGSENENFVLPNGIFIDDSDTIYVTDTGNNRVAIYN
jgi:sugar lactone lactonase YvrE